MRSNNSMPLITYITVVYNRESTIEKCINSVLNQDYSNIEYIIVDGASTDKTMDIVNKYRDRIDTVISEKDSGIYNAMNKGLRFATGDLICFMNSDDECMPGAARIVADTYLTSKADLIVGTRVLKQNGEVVFEHTYTRYPIHHCCFRYIQMYHQSTYASKDLFDKIGGFDERYSLLADWIWESKALDTGAKAEFINDKLAVFNYDGASAKGIIKRDEEWIEWAQESFPVLSREDAELFINCLDRGRTPLINAKILTGIAYKYIDCNEFIKVYYETLLLMCIEEYEEIDNLDSESLNRKKMLSQLLITSIASEQEESISQFKDNIEFLISLYDVELYSLLMVKNKFVHKKCIATYFRGIKANIKETIKHLIGYCMCGLRVKCKRRNGIKLKHMRNHYYKIREKYIE